MSREANAGLWRSLEELEAGSHADIAPTAHDTVSFTRREFLRLAGIGSAAALAGCRAPAETIVPAVGAENAADTRYYATAMMLGGCAAGLLVETHHGRPTKIEGNPLHPSSLGGTDVFAQAAIPELWRGGRLELIHGGGSAATRSDLEAALREASSRGSLRVLTRYESSPTLVAQLRSLLERFPGSRWHTWEPLHRDHSMEGARLAFGRAAQCVYRPAEADVLLALDADFAGSGPGHLRYASELASRRLPGERERSRLYAIECTPTLTGTLADHRLALAPARLERWLATLAQALESGNRQDSRTEEPTSPANVARALAARPGRALVVAGESLTPQAHALVHALNARLGASGKIVAYIEPVVGDVSCAASIAELAHDIEAGAVGALVILGGNPAYDAPADLGFAELIGKVPFSLHLAQAANETTRRCRWTVPGTHFLEQWSDARAHDGTASIVQPLIAPLTGGISAHELLATLLGTQAASPLEIVRAQWAARFAPGPGDESWREALREGIVRGTESQPLALSARPVRYAPASADEGWTLLLHADPSVRDGDHADSAWLQELPRPHSKLTWDNAIYASPAAARRLGAATGDLLEIGSNERRIRGPLWVLPGQSDATLSVALGYGRREAGEVGRNVGFDAYPLRSAANPWCVPGVTVQRVAGRHAFATTQQHARMDERDPVKRMRLADLVAGARIPDETPRESLYPDWPYEGYRWAMSIDLGACIGCSACTIACQAENNIPVVGKDQVRAGREMHWIRVDRYYEGEAESPRTHFQPVPCMHCERAPCEEVCPVGATVHDAEGLNVQVYNRCVGTRFCSQNCPYKVRRFNFLAVSARSWEPPLEARNPEVTVRMRGVMEKCNYCQQRIVRARIEADRENRRLREGEVVTACQAVCPTKAIVFGDLNDPQSAVAAARRSPRQYALLAELNTRPRTTYLAKVIDAQAAPPPPEPA
jgi:Fe-S-cluster-containing dehydrogenase component